MTNLPPAEDGIKESDAQGDLEWHEEHYRQNRQMGLHGLVICPVSD